MATVHGSDPVELRVLSALTAGASTVGGVAAAVGEPESVVEPILEWSVAEQRAVRLDLPGLPTYALTPKGVALLDFSQETQGGAVDTARVADLAGAAPSPVEQRQQSARPSSPRSRTLQRTRQTSSSRRSRAAGTGLGPGTASGGTSVSTDAAQPTVRWRQVVYAAAYVLLGLFMLLFQPIVGLVAVVAGLSSVASPCGRSSPRAGPGQRPLSSASRRSRSSRPLGAGRGLLDRTWSDGGGLVEPAEPRLEVGQRGGVEVVAGQVVGRGPRPAAGRPPGRGPSRPRPRG